MLLFNTTNYCLHIKLGFTVLYIAKRYDKGSLIKSIASMEGSITQCCHQINFNCSLDHKYFLVFYLLLNSMGYLRYGFNYDLNYN